MCVLGTVLLHQPPLFGQDISLHGPEGPTKPWQAGDILLGGPSQGTSSVLGNDLFSSE